MDSKLYPMRFIIFSILRAIASTGCLHEIYLLGFHFKSINDLEQPIKQPENNIKKILLTHTVLI